MHNVLLGKIHGIGKKHLLSNVLIMMHHVCSPAVVCACLSVCVCVYVCTKKRMWELTYLMEGVTCMFLESSTTLISSIALLPLLLSLLRQWIKPQLCFLFPSCLSDNTYSPSFSLFLSAIAPDFSQNLLKAQTLARQGGDVLIECRPRMSPRGVISWRKGKEALRESHRYQLFSCRAVSAFCAGSQLFSLSALLAESYFIDLLFILSYFVFMVTNWKEQWHNTIWIA